MRDKMAACAETTRGVTSSVLTHAHNAKCNLPRDTCLWYSVYTMTPCLKKLLKALLIIILKSICHCLDADFNSSYDIQTLARHSWQASLRNNSIIFLIYLLHKLWI